MFRFPRVVQNAVVFGDLTVAHTTAQPGWRWSIDMRPLVGGEMARSQLENFNGREVKTTGDGILATFDGPVHALRCAAAIGERARRDDLHIRAGVHVGEVELVGGDIRGVAVHEAERITGAAAPDEILVSETTRALALASGVTFSDRGMHALKGIGDSRLFAYDTDGTPPTGDPATRNVDRQS